MHWLTELTVAPGRIVHRRDVLRAIPLAGVLSGLHSIALASNTEKRGACIMLWMQGGPSQFETFSPKPGHPHGGPTKSISTRVPGIEVSANLPRLAQRMDQLALIRSLHNKEGNHIRASYQMHTGYPPNAAVKHPSLGSLAAAELPNPECELPSFVRIGTRGSDYGGGFLGVEYDPFNLDSAERLPENTASAVAATRLRRRTELLSQAGRRFALRGGEKQAADHLKLYNQAVRMVTSRQFEAFDVSREPDPSRTSYGRTAFGSACLLARRLVEAGVSFVEVELPKWDTHQENFPRTANLAAQLDHSFSHLLDDLRERGLLDSTLVVCLGEFGRTPKINARGGRDHFPKAFDAALAGCRIRGGQVIGRTDGGGESIIERPVSVPDLFQSICRALGIDAAKERMAPGGRPLATVDGGEVISELFS